MRARIAVVVAALALAVPAAASAAINQGPGRGNPDTNPAGKCPPGHNPEGSLSTGGLKKCG